MTDLQRFIPFARHDVIDMCARRLPDEQVDGFRSLSQILTAYIHVEFHDRLERLKRSYAPFARDSDLRAVSGGPPVDLQAARHQTVTELQQLLEDANFEPIGHDELGRAFESESLMKVRVHVDFDDFDQVLFYRRGVVQDTAQVKVWGGLRTREIAFTTYSRVVVVVGYKDAETLGEERSAELDVQPGSLLIKLFQNVPRADLEMLFPRTEVRMRTIDKVLLGVPAAVSGAIVVSTKLLGSLGLVALLLAFYLGLRDEPVTLDQGALLALAAGLASLVTYIAKQWSKFKNRKILFMKRLSESLYFRNLGNDVGVFFHLLDAAEEEEVKESVLAYSALLARGPMTEEELDTDVEAWLADQLDATLDFEVSDALGDLTRLQLVEREGRRYRAVDPEDAHRRLDQRWDAIHS